MKIRQGLISNSSSTSFIVSYKPGKICECCERKSVDIYEQLEHNHFGNDDYQIYAQGIENIKQEIKDNWYDDNKEEMIKKLDSIPKDHEVIYFSISMHDFHMINEIESIEKTGGKILFRSND